MVTNEREMVRTLIEEADPVDRFTSLQPTYEDTVPPDPDDWDRDQD